MENADFRALLLSKERERANENKKKGAVESDKEGKGTKYDERNNNQKMKRTKKKNFDNDEEDFLRKKVKYRDRAQERRLKKDDDDDDDLLKESDRNDDRGGNLTNERGVFEEPEMIKKDKRMEEYERSKYLGGDEARAHLVKGLDFALKRKVEREQRAEEKAAATHDVFVVGDDIDDDDKEDFNLEEDYDNNLTKSTSFLSAYVGKSNVGRAIITKLTNIEKQRKDSLRRTTKIPPLSGVSYIYDVDCRIGEVTRVVGSETKPRADIEEEMKARRREFAKISKEEERILSAVSKAIREPPNIITTTTKDDEEEVLAAAGKNSRKDRTTFSNNNDQQIKNEVVLDESDSEDIFGDVGKDYDAIAEIEKEEKSGKIVQTTTIRTSAKLLFDGEALAKPESAREADENIKKMDDAYERKRLEDRAEMVDDAYGEYYPGFDAGLSAEIDDDDEEKYTPGEENMGEDDNGKKGKKGKKELTEAQKIKQKENEDYQLMQKMMAEKHGEKFNSAFGLENSKKNDKDEGAEKEDYQDDGIKKRKKKKETNNNNNNSKRARLKM
jgi:hypothetical protein